jgi:cell division protease FtsH
MSSVIGTVAVLPMDGQGPLLPGTAEVSEETHRLVDEEVRRLVSALHEEVVALLRENRARIDSLANALLEHETLDQADAYAAAGIEVRKPDVTGDYAVAAARSTTDQ